MMKTIICIAVLPLWLIPLAAPALFAEKTPDRMTVAVAHFDANNCRPALARAVADMLAGRLFTIDFFVLLERGQMDLIMREKGIQAKKLNSADDAAELGKLLSVQKMVVGSVSRLRKFRVEVRVVNVDDGSVDISLSRTVRAEGQMEEAVAEMALKIERHYRGYSSLTEKADLAVTGTVLQAAGDFAKGAGLGYGLNLNVFWNRPFGGPVPLVFITGFYSFPPVIESIDSIYMLPLEIHLSYPFRLTKIITLQPSIGGGYILSWINYDTIERTVSPKRFREGFYYNPLLSVRLELSILVYDRWAVSLAPKYSLFFESNKIAHLPGGELGVRILF